MQGNRLKIDLTFEKLPQAVEYLIRKVEALEALLREEKSELTESDKWFNIEDLCAYLPDKPAKQTVYSWVSNKRIPYHKQGKKLQFLKSDIDNWLKSGKRKSVDELKAEAHRFVNEKKERSAAL